MFSIKDSVRNLIVKSLASTRIVFHHIPKTAGTSLRAALGESYNSKWLRRRRDCSISASRTAGALTRVFGELAEDTVDQEDIRNRYTKLQEFRQYLLLNELEAGTPFIGGHVAFSRDIYNAYQNEYCFVTVFRDPVERFVSHYVMNRHRGGHLATKLEFEEYLESGIGLLTATMATDFLSGYAKADVSQRLSYAKDNIGCFRLIGFADDLPKFVTRLQSLIGVPFSLPRRRVTEAPEEAQRILTDARLRKRIQERCEADIDLYDHARSMQERNEE